MSSRQQREAERSVRGDSPTNALRLWSKQRAQRRRPPQLEPIQRKQQEDGEEATSKQIQGPLTMQRLVDDFVSAAGAGDADKVAQYVRRGIPIDRPHSLLRYNALHASAALRRSDIARFLLEAGADVNALTQDHDTALHLAARYGCTDVAQELMRYGINKRIVNNKGMIAMEVALDIQNRDLGRLLEPPPNAPSSVNVVETSPYSLDISWKTRCDLPSPCLFALAWRLNNAKNGEWIHHECTEPRYQIQDLLPATEYTVGVKAGNHLIGWSASSLLVVFRTDNDVPNAVKAPIVTEIGSTFISVGIHLPRENGSQITRLALQCLCIGSAFQGNSTTASESVVDRADNWDTRVWNLDCSLNEKHSNERTGSRSGRKSARVTGSYMELKADGLSPGRTYLFKAKACNDIGWSLDGDISDKLSTEDCPQVVSKGARTVTLAWTKAIVNGHPADSYRIDAKLDRTDCWETLAIGYADVTISASGLSPFSSYVFRVVPHFPVTGWVDPTTCAISALTRTETAPPEPPTNLHIVEITATTITVSWQLPRCNGHGVLNFTLEIRKSSQSLNSWQLVNASIPVGTESFEIRQLQIGAAYSVRVRANNILGGGEFAELPCPVRTCVLFSPQPPYCVSKTSFSLHLLWEDAAQGALQESNEVASVAETSKIHHRYHLQMRQLEVSQLSSQSSQEWTTAAEDLSERQCVVPNLHPLRHYCFRVRVYLSCALSDNCQPSPSTALHAFEISSAFSACSDVIQTLRRV